VTDDLRRIAVQAPELLVELRPALQPHPSFGFGPVGEMGRPANEA
jgi:hypothetical protein